MSDPLTGLLDPTRLVFDLQQANEIAQRFSGCLEPEEIAHCTTEGLVEKFGCAFARIWLLEVDQAILRLVASSGMYTNLNGFFGRVPMGAYKVGKIAQNRISFLSNNLAAESWVGNREWAIAHNIRGFAGYPLAINDRVIGVLATFSHHQMEPEFLEVLQTLCTIVSIALDTALRYQKEKQGWHSSLHHSPFKLSLSEQLASILSSARLTLVGTEHPLALSTACIFLQAAEILHPLECTYCRLIYSPSWVSLEAIVPTPPSTHPDRLGWINTQLTELVASVSCAHGTLQTQTGADQRAIQITLKLPSISELIKEPLHIQCRSSVLQLAFTRLAVLAGFRVFTTVDESPDLILLTDDTSQIQPGQQVVWIQHSATQPKGIRAMVDLSTTPEQLQQAVGAVRQGKLWNLNADPEFAPAFSERELEILTLLTQGHRDRDIADRLIISESTVKFHMNNVLSKLKVRTRYQAIHQAIVNGWIQ